MIQNHIITEQFTRGTVIDEVVKMLPYKQGPDEVSIFRVPSWVSIEDMSREIRNIHTDLKFIIVKLFVSIYEIILKGIAV